MRFVRCARALPLLVVSVVILSSCVLLRPPSFAVTAASLPSLSIRSVSVTEGNAGTVNATFTVTLSAATAKTVTVRYATANAWAHAPDDFGAASGTMRFVPRGRTAKTFTVLVNGDRVVELDETFSVNLSVPTNAAISRGRVTGTIKNDDATPSLTIDDVAVPEQNVGTTNAVFTVTLSAPSSRPVTVDYATLDASATAASDYNLKMDTLTFAPGVVSTTVSVAINGDTLPEPDETLYVTLTNAVRATIADSFGQGTILNDDATVPSLSISSPTSVTEGNAGTVNAVFTVTMSVPSLNTVTVEYATADGSATAPSDYTAGSGTLTYAPGQTIQSIAVLVDGDTLSEINEVFTVNLSGPINATITGTGVAAATITNDDTLPTLTLASPAALTEGNAGTTVNAVFTVTLSAISTNTVTVDYTTVDGSAIASSVDYVAQSGTLTYAPGQTNQQIAVIVKGDTTVETNETLTVNLSNPASATIAGTGVAAATITNDDTLPTLSINSVSQVEGTGGTTNLVLTVSLSTASGLPVTVDFATANGAAVAPGDYASQTGTLTFSPGQTTKTITVAVVADAVNEANEAFTVVLSSPTNATIASGTGTGTIQNDD